MNMCDVLIVVIMLNITLPIDFAMTAENVAGVLNFNVCLCACFYSEFN